MMMFSNGGYRKTHAYKSIQLMLVSLSLLTFVLIPAEGVIARGVPIDDWSKAPSRVILRGHSHSGARGSQCIEFARGGSRCA